MTNVDSLARGCSFSNDAASVSRSTNRRCANREAVDLGFINPNKPTFAIDGNTGGQKDWKALKHQDSGTHKTRRKGHLSFCVTNNAYARLVSLRLTLIPRIKLGEVFSTVISAYGPEALNGRFDGLLMAPLEELSSKFRPLYMRSRRHRGTPSRRPLQNPVARNTCTCRSSLRGFSTGPFDTRKENLAGAFSPRLHHFLIFSANWYKPRSHQI